MNPWTRIDIANYENHMGHPKVAQLQLLDRIMGQQFDWAMARPGRVSSLAVLGVTQGNGLSRLNHPELKEIIGLDINPEFLAACRSALTPLADKLNLHQIDLINEKHRGAKLLAKADLIVANLVIEHIHLNNFLDLVNMLPHRPGRLVSCVIQHNPDGHLASRSGFESAFDEVVSAAREIGQEELIQGLTEANYELSNRFLYELPNRKQFIRLDFASQAL